MTELWALTASAGDVDADARDELSHRIDRWLAAGHAGVALTTCHRVELYGIGPAPALHGTRLRRGPDAVFHLMRVAAGLESAIVGEDEVLHQVRDALRQAQDGRPLDFRLRQSSKPRSRPAGEPDRAARNPAAAWLRTRSRG